MGKELIFMKYKIAKSKIDSSTEVIFDIQRFVVDNEIDEMEGTSEADNFINNDNNMIVRGLGGDDTITTAAAMSRLKAAMMPTTLAITVLT